MHRKAPIPIHAILHEEDCELFVRISITRPRRPVAMVSAITSPDQTGAKVYYQSGPGLVPVRAMEASQPFGGQYPRLPLKNETGTNPYY